MEKSMKELSVKKIKFIGDDKFLFGLNELSSQLNFTLSNDGYEVSAIKVDGKILSIETTKDKAIIYYPKDNNFFKGFSFAVQYLGQEKTIKIETLFSDLGTMQNCSDGLLNVNTLKDFTRQSAILGYTNIGIYTEGTYQVDGEPYFGYKAGAYSTQELQEIVSYAEKFFVEAIPYVQTLSHLNQIFRWPEYGQVKDVEDILLVDFDKTYDLLEKMFCSLRKAYKTSKINLGMDEAYRIGTGRYRWFVNEELVDTVELFIRHLKKVLAMAEKYGFTMPEIWYDNIFGMKFKGYICPPDWLFKDLDDKIRKEFPNVKLNFWYYAIESQAEMKRAIKNIRQLSSELSFSTIIHGYTSFAPINSFAEKACDFVKDTCLNNGINEITITSWGGKTIPFTMLAGYLKFMESFAIGSGYDLEERAKFLYGYTYSELKQLDLPNEVDFEEKKQNMYEYNPPVYILADDPLLGIMEKHIPPKAKEYYLNAAKILEELENKGGRYSQVFNFEKTLCLALAEKAFLSKSLKDAYDKKDKKVLLEVIEQMTIAIEKIKDFHRVYRKNWLDYFKSFGVELFDARFGGLVSRLGFIKETIQDYVDGEIDKIEELEEIRLPYHKGYENKIICGPSWDNVVIGRNMRI